MPRTLTLAALLLLGARTADAQGLASKYPGDVGLDSDPAVLYFLDFDDQQTTSTWSAGKEGYGWTDDSSNVFAGKGALEIQQTTGTHDPYEIHPEIAGSDVVYVRWYRKWETGYDFTQHKMSGVYARAPDVGGGGAGIKPNGYDKYSCKLYVDFDGHPRFYTYHPEQEGEYGDGLHMNLVDPKIQMTTDRWYCFEMMIKANKAGSRDGELKMWIDGELVGHYTDMRFRDTDTLKINEFTYSAYVGGTWVSERDQKLWDDQIVVAREYIGPLVTSAADAGPSADGSPDAGPSGTGPTDSGVSAVDHQPTGPAAGDRSSSQGASGGCAIGSGHGFLLGPLLALLTLWFFRRRAAQPVRF